MSHLIFGRFSFSSPLFHSAMKKCFSLFVFALFGGSTALGQCVYTTTKDGNFSDPSIYTGGCTTMPAAGSTIIINNKVVLNQSFTSTGTITIGATGALVQDATSRTLAMNGGTLTIAATTARAQPQLSVAVLNLAKTTANVGANSTISVGCTLFTGNQTTINLGNNSLLNVLGNVDVATGNPGIVGPATGTPAGLRINGNIVNNSGGGAKLFTTANLIACVQQKTIPAGCTTSSTSIVTPPASNDPTCQTVLPVTLTRFSATELPEKKQVLLSWATASEVDNAYFAVERSVDGHGFETLGRVEGAGSSNNPHTYTYVDEAPVADLAYYRLRQTDFDGSVTYSPTVVLTARSVAADWLQPLDAPRSYAVRGNLGGGGQLAVLDVLGRPLYTQTLAASPALVVLPALPTGVYLFRLVTPQGRFTARQAVAAGR